MLVEYGLVMKESLSVVAGVGENILKLFEQLFSGCAENLVIAGLAT